MNKPQHSLMRTVFGIALVLTLPRVLLAQINVLISGGFSTAYNELLSEFQQATGIKVSTASGASQGKGADTIGAQIRRGAPADVVIMSREGLSELIAEGKVITPTVVDLAQTLIGVAVRAGAPKPDISTVEAFKRTLVTAKSVAIPTSTTGVYLTRDLFPKLGIGNAVVVRSTSRGAASVALVAGGDAQLSIQPVSEILHMPGVEFAGLIPKEIQFVSVFSAAVVAGSKQTEVPQRLIAFLASEKARAAIIKSGMEPLGRR
jgi:molybdate transport system substrate-binding protein